MEETGDVDTLIIAKQIQRKAFVAAWVNEVSGALHTWQPGRSLLISLSRNLTAATRTPPLSEISTVSDRCQATVGKGAGDIRAMTNHLVMDVLGNVGIWDGFIMRGEIASTHIKNEWSQIYVAID